jgi:hypothetical protein
MFWALSIIFVEFIFNMRGCVNQKIEIKDTERIITVKEILIVNSCTISNKIHELIFISTRTHTQKLCFS